MKKSFSFIFLALAACAVLFSSCGSQDPSSGELTTKRFEGRVFGNELWYIRTVDGDGLYVVVDKDQNVSSVDFPSGKSRTSTVMVDGTPVDGTDDASHETQAALDDEQAFVTVDGHRMSVEDARKVLRVRR